MANSYLSKTPNAGNRRTWTLSLWFKRSGLTNGGLFVAGTGGGNESTIRVESNQVNWIEYNSSSASIAGQLITNQLLRDTSAWYHLVCAWDSTNSTAGDRMKMYINGSRVTSFANDNNPSLNYDSEINANDIHNIGRQSWNSSSYFDGYMSHVAFVDGQALAPTVFGETDSTSGIWKFKNPTGVTWGTNGFHLKFENSGNLGLDSSGNSNTFTVNGDGRQALDTPSNVHCTWNRLASKVIGTTSWTLRDGNLSFVPTSNTNQWTTGTLCPAAGKWYWEVKSTQSGGGDWPDIGIMFTDSISQHMYVTGNPQHNFSYAAGIEPNGTRWAFGTQTTSWFSGYNSGDIINCAVDIDAGKLWWGVNGSWLNSGDPANGTNPGATFTAGTSFTPWTEQYQVSNAEVQANFGNGYFSTTAISSAGSNGNGSLFEYDVPSGYYALNTKNINTYG
jgi:hypothetical protein